MSDSDWSDEYSDCDVECEEENLTLDNVIEVNSIRFVLKDNPTCLDFFNTLIELLNKKNFLKD